jgi:sec-independent protein translocase protein TatA
VLRMFGLGMPELLVIGVIALVFFGPGKLPELGGAIGKSIKDFKKSMEEPDNKLEDLSKANKSDDKKG